jgi:hypothetical protein
MTALATANSKCKRQTHPLVSEDVAASVQLNKKMLVVVLKGLGAKTN